MYGEKRKDLSYNLWGDPALGHYEKNKVTFYMNPRYGEGKSISFDSDLCIYPTLTEYTLDYNLIKDNICFYKENSIFLGKILKGKFALKGKDNNGMIFKEGDIFCFSGNFVLNEKYHFNDKQSVSIIGVFGYHKEILDAFDKRNWSTSSVKSFLEDPDLEKGIVLDKTYELNRIIDDLHVSMSNDDCFTSFLKSLELFYYFSQTMKKKEHKKIKTYKQEQVDTVIEIKNYLDNNLDCYYSMPKLASMFNISLSRMQSIFVDYYNLSPYKYHLNKRLEKSKDLIVNTDIKMIEIAKMVGFTSYDNFFKAYRSRYGCNPSEDRMT